MVNTHSGDVLFNGHLHGALEHVHCVVGVQANVFSDIFDRQRLIVVRCYVFQHLTDVKLRVFRYPFRC